MTDQNISDDMAQLKDERCPASDGGEMPHWWLLTDHDGVRYRSRRCMLCHKSEPVPDITALPAVRDWLVEAAKEEGAGVPPDAGPTPAASEDDRRG